MLYCCEPLITATEVTLKPLEKAHNQALRLITGGIKSTPIDAMLQVTGNTTIGSLIKEKALILYEKLLRIPMDQFFSSYENRPRHLKTQSGLIQKAIELKKALQIDDQPKSLSLPMNPLADIDVVCRTQLLDFFRKSNTPPEQMRSLALETINVNYPADQWLQVFTDGSYTENQANVGAGVYSELFSFYAAAGHNRSAFEGEIEAIRIALRQLCCLDTKFTKAVILSDSQSSSSKKQQFIPSVSLKPATTLAKILGAISIAFNFGLVESNLSVSQQYNLRSHINALASIMNDLKQRHRTELAKRTSEDMAKSISLAVPQLVIVSGNQVKCKLIKEIAIFQTTVHENHEETDEAILAPVRGQIIRSLESLFVFTL
ncbi:unnamed protein product [Rodentolepis nana]|uniref:RNase H domain-containing protein n=1 Tax=Rodentolepis nana TaxID=102285 RepID=A0A0R3TVS1_RODNA|nr:unnamed protein product [Rodentolepis nana]